MQKMENVFKELLENKNNEMSEKLDNKDTMLEFRKMVQEKELINDIIAVVNLEINDRIETFPRRAYIYHKLKIDLQKAKNIETIVKPLAEIHRYTMEAHRRKKTPQYITIYDLVEYTVKNYKRKHETWYTD